MAHTYMKADDWVGKHLSLHVGRADRTVRDGEVLEGPQWARFVGMGFLKPVGEEAVEAAARARAAAAPEREPMLSAPQPPEGLTKAPKVPAPGKSTSTKTPEPKAADEYDSMEYNDLVAEVAKRELDTPDRKKDTLIKALREDDAK